MRFKYSTLLPFSNVLLVQCTVVCIQYIHPSIPIKYIIYPCVPFTSHHSHTQDMHSLHNYVYPQLHFIPCSPYFPLTLCTPYTPFHTCFHTVNPLSPLTTYVPPYTQIHSYSHLAILIHTYTPSFPCTHIPVLFINLPEFNLLERLNNFVRLSF